MNSKEKMETDMKLDSNITANSGGHEAIKLKHIWNYECFDSQGNLKWTYEDENLIVDEGLDEVLDKFWKGSAYTAAHYVGLTDGTPTPAAGDDMTTHAGWVEVVAYTEGTREVLTLGTVATQSVDNSASKAIFNINGTTTVGGAFIATDSTKSGTGGILMSISALSGDRSLESGDILNITVTLTAS